MKMIKDKLGSGFGVKSHNKTPAFLMGSYISIWICNISEVFSIDFFRDDTSDKTPSFEVDRHRRNANNVISVTDDNYYLSLPCASLLSLCFFFFFLLYPLCCCSLSSLSLYHHH